MSDASKRMARFLVVDDFDPMRKMIRDNLARMGFTDVTVASDGQEAVTYLQTHKVNAIISDWNMPKLNGLQLLRHVRQTPRLRNIPFMMVTAEDEREAVMSAIAEGVDQFLVKPFTFATLRQKVRQMIERSHTPLAHPPHRGSPGGATAVVAGEAEAGDRSGPPTVLVIDDEPTNIDVVAGILRDGYRVKAATSGAKALALAKSDKPPDLILLDIMMPEMDGIECCRRLKGDPDTEAIPVIFLTAKAESADMTAGFAAGGVDYVVKPADPPVLRARVDTHLRLKRASDDLRSQIDTLVENARLREDVERITRHDLKNPLTAIINTIDMLGESQGRVIEHRNDVKTIREAAYDILGMINRSLDLYKMETGTYRLTPEPVDIIEITNRVVKEARANGRKNGISVLFEAPDACLCAGEPMLCLSLLGNLLRNAVEASPPKARVTVRIDCGEWVRIDIHNRGCIPEAIRGDFFGKYVTAAKQTGTGLGTYSAKLMTEIQGGEIGFVSDPEHGTTLTVTLPHAPVQHA